MNVFDGCWPRELLPDPGTATSAMQELYHKPPLPWSRMNSCSNSSATAARP